MLPIYDIEYILENENLKFTVYYFQSIILRSFANGNYGKRISYSSYNKKKH